MVKKVSNVKFNSWDIRINISQMCFCGIIFPAPYYLSCLYFFFVPKKLFLRNEWVDLTFVQVIYVFNSFSWWLLWILAVGHSLCLVCELFKINTSTPLHSLCFYCDPPTHPPHTNTNFLFQWGKWAGELSSD